ncbi:MAG: BrnA antitoxin family protein [Defluviicoccus sp.]|nr:BrnA antitoxin family protein [Defluviicoccus sp.]
MADIDAIPDDGLDTSDIPEMDEKFFATAKLVMPPGASKKAVSLRVDEDVFDWFKAQGKGHLSRMNAVLRAYMLANRGA